MVAAQVVQVMPVTRILAFCDFPDSNFSAI